jgi:ribosomal protein S18 acetylase RimI-like enzyme
MVVRVAEFCRERSVQLAQVLLDPGDASNRRLFESAGFRWLSQLIYLQRSLGRAPSLPAPALPVGFAWETYSAGGHERFAQTIQSSYQNSLDCPALNGLRSMTDVMAGHQAAGEFDPAWWLLLREHEALRAVLLLARSPHSEMAELVYLGLVPEARGRGIGGVLMRQALHLAARGGCARLSLAVDAQNTPALKLYYRHGLQRLCARDAMIRDLR